MVDKHLDPIYNALPREKMSKEQIRRFLAEKVRLLNEGADPPVISQEDFDDYCRRKGL